MAATTYRGESARIQIGSFANPSYSGKTQSVLGLSDFSITIDRGTVEQELVGESGNYFAAGSMSIDGSLTGCKLDNTAVGSIVRNLVSGTRVWVSGAVGANSLSFYFVSCAITNFELTMGDADTITEGSLDWQVLDPQWVTLTKTLNAGTYITETYA